MRRCLLESFVTEMAAEVAVRLGHLAPLVLHLFPPMFLVSRPVVVRQVQPEGSTVVKQKRKKAPFYLS